MDYACLFATGMFFAVLVYAIVRRGSGPRRHDGPVLKLDPDGQREWWR